MKNVKVELTRNELREIILALEFCDLENKDYCNAKEKIEQAIIKLEPEEG